MIPFLLLAMLVQTPETLSGVVKDATGAPMQGAVVTVTAPASRQTAITAADGAWSIHVAGGPATVALRVDAQGFAAERREIALPSAAPIVIELRPQAIAEQVTVTAESAPTRLAVDSSVTSIDRTTIAETPALRLDDQLRAVPGFSLFRRTTSAVANPTTQGVTLRGLSASGASRTLVVADDVPLNDPFGAWVYWNRVPVAALQRVDVVRGASGDIHGNDALGGVIRLTTRTGQGGEAWFEGGNLGNVRGSFYGALTRGSWLAGAAAESGKTDGFIVVAPEVRGPIDVNADSQGTSAMAWVGGVAGAVQITGRGGYFTEDRGNGTPAQINGTITRWGSANAHALAFGGLWEARGDFTANNYNQTFSAVTTVNGVARAGERLTSLQWVGSTGGGATVSWMRQMRRGDGLVSFAERVVHANLDEAAIVNGVQAPTARTVGRQRNTGIVAHGRYELTPKITLTAGARGEWWALKSPTRRDHVDVQDQFFFRPRIAATIAAAEGQTIRVSWLTGFRTPTINELFRSFRVGSTLTNANPDLKSEESWGPEAAFTMTRRQWTARALFYATKLDNAIYNRTVTSTPSAITRIRDNADARAIGSEIEFEYRVRTAWSLTTAWAFNDSQFTSGELDGKRVPQVPKVAGSVGVRAGRGPWSASAMVRVFGQQFDDDINTLILRAGSITDARAAWKIASRAELFGAVENAFDNEIDTGKTPIRTIGAPRQMRAGIIIKF
jgi:outer membrane receptor protein involved in Fe transport